MFRATGCGGGIGSTVAVIVLVPREEKVIRSRAFSFINFTTFSFKIDTSVFSSSIFSTVCDFFGLVGGLTIGPTDITIASSLAILAACSAGSFSSAAIRLDCSAIFAFAASSCSDNAISLPFELGLRGFAGLWNFGLETFARDTFGADPHGSAPITGDTSWSQCIHASADGIAGSPLGQGTYKSEEQASILRGTINDIVCIVLFSILRQRKISFFSCSTTRFGNKQNPRCGLDER